MKILPQISSAMPECACIDGTRATSQKAPPVQWLAQCFPYSPANLMAATLSMDEIEENQLRVCAEWIEGMEHPTPQSVIRHRDESCVHIQRPLSMHIPRRNNEQYSKYFTKLLLPNLHNFKVCVPVEKRCWRRREADEQKVTWNVLANDARRNVLVFAATATGESPAGPYDNEYICAFRFTKDGTKITQIDEFVDSKFTADFFARLYLATHHKPNPSAKL